eukprot:m.270697 g.270697  ORF g.270697 m.270697 type:complete len:372 (+) comp40543_c0_seq146:2860-3975(+)
MATDASGAENVTKPFKFVLNNKPEFTDFENQSENVQIAEGQELELKFSISRFTVVDASSVVLIFENGTSRYIFNVTGIDLNAEERVYVFKIAGHTYNSGVYTCKATNQFGATLSSPVKVTVDFFDQTKFIFQITPSVAEEDESVVFSVETSSSPSPSVIVVTNPSGKVMHSAVEESSIQFNVTARKDFTGSYKAITVHQTENYTRTSSLTVLSVPDVAPPDDVALTLISASSHSFNYTWTVGSHGTAPITSTTLCCTRQPADVRDTSCANGHNKTTQASSTSDTVDGLAANTTYYCQLFAISSVGSSGSEMKPVTTQAAGNLSGNGSTDEGDALPAATIAAIAVSVIAAVAFGVSYGVYKCRGQRERRLNM